MLIDVDLFKNVNDTLGHSAGDQLIGKVADALRDRLRDGEVIARLGGDEFAVLVPDGGPEDAEQTASELLEAIRAVRISSSSGRLRNVSVDRRRPVRLAPPDRRGRARQRGPRDVRSQGGGPRPGRLPRHHQGRRRLATRLSWTDVIRDALDEERLVLQAQPIMDLASGEIHQYELLLRMRDLLGELISPRRSCSWPSATT